MKQFLIVSMATLALAACHREGPSDENSVNIVADNAFENIMPDESMVPVDNALTATNVVEAAPPPSIDEQQQMQEDADATGMTARSDRTAAANQADSTAPVEEK